LTFVFLYVGIVSSYSSAAYIKPTTDPTSVGIGARPIGMGNAYVGLADDVNSIFINPAGLADIKSWQVQSMTTRLLNVIDYISLAGTYNTDYGTFGLGYVGANLSGSFVTGLTIISDRGIIIPVVSKEAIDYTSSVVLLSYGTDPKKFLDYGWLDNVRVGLTLKLFTQGLSGGGISNGTLTGYDMDMGILYRPLPYLSFGFSELDFLPESGGGKLTDASGDRIETLPSMTKFGIAFKVLGDTDAYYKYPQPLTYMLDYNHVEENVGYPGLLCTGIEFWPSEYLALRLGFDQDIVGTATSKGFDIETNITTGVGVVYNGFKFDYAFHRYGNLSENDTSYLSLSYASPLEIAMPAPVEEKKQLIILYIPSDKLITRDQAVVFKGLISDTKKVSYLTVNGAPLDFSSTGTFESTYPLVLGKNIFEVKAIDNNNAVVETARIRILRLASFKDIPEGYWTKNSIEYLATLGVIGGYPDGTFKPDKSISRAELTTLLVKAKGISSTETVDTMFGDVTKKHWASFYVRNGADMGWITGYPDKTFKPGKTLTRAEGVTIISRFAGLAEPETLLEGPFPDVAGRHWAAKSITAARSAGMLKYLIDKPFEPNKEMTRAEASEIISLTPFAVEKITDLTSFESY